MSKGAQGALALILLWVAFASFFVAFHPGGIKDPAFVTPSNPQGYARNPVDVIIWMIRRAAQGPNAPAQTTTTAAGGGGAAAPPPAGTTGSPTDIFPVIEPGGAIVPAPV